LRHSTVCKLRADNSKVELALMKKCQKEWFLLLPVVCKNNFVLCSRNVSKSLLKKIQD